MPLSKYFRLEALTLIAFLATIPIYSPNHLLFETGVFDVPTFMAPFANTMLFSTLVLGTLAALASGRRCPEEALGPRMGGGRRGPLILRATACL